jgi:hypothetical protein
MSSSGLPSPFKSSIDPGLTTQHQRWAARSLAAEEPAEEPAEPAACGCRSAGACTTLRHEPRDHHRQHRQHLFEHVGAESGLGRRILRDGTAHVLRAEDLPEHVIAVVQIRRLWCEHFGQQPSAAELTEQPAEAFEPGRLCLRLLLESTQDGWSKCGSASGRLALADVQFPRHGLESPHLGEDVGDLHALPPLSRPF